VTGWIYYGSFRSLEADLERTHDGMVEAVDSGDDEKRFLPSTSKVRPPIELEIAVPRSGALALPRDVGSTGRHELQEL
jgi:hypothetical protein